MISDAAKKLGEALVSAKVLTREQLSSTLARAEKNNSSSLIIHLLESDILTFSVFEKFLAASLGIKSVIVGGRNILPTTLALIQKKTIIENFIFPIEHKIINGKDHLILGMVDPLDAVALEKAKKESNCHITIYLMSLGDFKSVSENETAFQKQMHDDTKINERQKNIKPKEIDLDSAHSSSQRADQVRVSPYIGLNHTCFKEEVLAKLDLAGVDAKRMGRENYDREALFKELPEISLRPLKNAFESLSPDLKIESILNALIEKQILTKREVYQSGAISYIFKDSKSSDAKSGETGG